MIGPTEPKTINQTWFDFIIPYLAAKIGATFATLPILYRRAQIDVQFADRGLERLPIVNLKDCPTGEPARV